MMNILNRIDKNNAPKKALRWAISIILPSIILFFANQVLVTWNLSNLLTAVEKSESNMKSFSTASNVNKPGKGVEGKYWSEHGMDLEYIGPRDRWARASIVPAAEKYLPIMKKSIAELEDLKLYTFDTGMKLAKDTYLLHANEWLSALQAISKCSKRQSDSYLWQCIDDYYYYQGDAKIESTWNAAKLEFERISPMFGFYNINSRISKIFEM